MNMLLPVVPTSSNRALRRISTLAAFAFLVGCAGAPERISNDLRSVPWPEFAQQKPNETLYRIDTAASHLRIRVDPEGPMARLGHSHVIGGSVISGTILVSDGGDGARADLSVDAAALEVDAPPWRAADGLEPELDQAAIAATRKNMLGERVLDVADHPEISIRTVQVSGPIWMADATARIRLRGEVREVVFPVAVDLTDRQLTVRGVFDLLQTEFGIEPFSAAGGALRVSDRMRIRFLIVAKKDGGP